jgi:hypothetical protein
MRAHRPARPSSGELAGVRALQNLGRTCGPRERSRDLASLEALVRMAGTAVLDCLRLKPPTYTS